MDSTMNFTELSTMLDGNQTEIHSTPPWISACDIALNVLVVMITYGIMVVMGSDITWNQLKTTMKVPKYVFVSLLGQYVFMPFCGFLAVQIFQIDGFLATGILITCCSPGGPLSNLANYLLDADVPLSVILTTLSNMLSFGVMPANIYVYSKAGIAAGSLNIPYLKMFISLVLLNVALAIGMAIRWKAPNSVSYFTKGGVALMSVSNVVFIVLWFVVNPDALSIASLSLHMAVIFVCFLSMAITALVAVCWSFPVRIVKAVGIEASYQSMGVAYTVSVISFEKQDALTAQKFILLYNLYITIFSNTAAIIYQLWKRHNGQQQLTQDKHETDEDLNCKFLSNAKDSTEGNKEIKQII